MNARHLSFLFIATLAACGGSSAPPSETPPAGTPESATPPPSAASSATPSAAPSEPAAAAPAATAQPAAPPAKPELPPAKLDVSGKVDGKTFTPKIGYILVVSPDGFANVTITDKEPCRGLDDGDYALGIQVPWKDGSSVELDSKREFDAGTKKISVPTTVFVKNKVTKRPPKDGIPNDKIENKAVAGFTPKGKATVVSAPTAKDAMGRLQIDLTSGGYTLKGDIDVKVCMDVKTGS